MISLVYQITEQYIFFYLPYDKFIWKIGVYKNDPYFKFSVNIKTQPEFLFKICYSNVISGYRSSDVINIDSSKAFAKVNRTILFCKLKSNSLYDIQYYIVLLSYSRKKNIFVGKSFCFIPSAILGSCTDVLLNTILYW